MLHVLFSKALAVLSVAAGCHHNSTPLVTPAAPTLLTRAPGIPEPDLTGVDLGSAWRHVVDSTRTVISSDQFKAALGRIAKMDPNVGAKATTGLEVLTAYSGASSTLGQVVTQYVLTGTTCEEAGQTASTLLVDATPKGPARTWYARVTLNPCTLERALSSSDGEFACAVNTAAHEWTHAVLNGDEQLYQDKGHGGDRNPMVSYTVGAIAQCVYLATRPTPRIPATAIDACVAKVGTHSFDPKSCSDEWAKQFGGSATIRAM